MKNILKKNLKNLVNVQLYLKNNILYIEGNKGNLCINIHKVLKKNFKKKKEYFILCSTIFRLIEKQIAGVSLSFVKRLFFIGVGYRVESIDNGIIKFKLGYSHFIFVKVPTYIQVSLIKKTILNIESIDAQLLTEFCSKIQKLKFPDSYKGKGILYKNQKIELKEGKKK